MRSWIGIYFLIQMYCVELSSAVKGLWYTGIFPIHWPDGYAMLMSPNKGETAVHGGHCRGDVAVRMRKVLSILRSCVVWPLLSDGLFLNFVSGQGSLAHLSYTLGEPTLPIFPFNTSGEPFTWEKQSWLG